MSEAAAKAFELFKGDVGNDEGTGEWFQVTQDQIDQFADVTHDHQFIHVDPEQAAQRTRRPDRIEQEGLAFQREVDLAYRELAQLFPNRITTLDGTRSASELAKEVRDELRAFA